MAECEGTLPLFWEGSAVGNIILGDNSPRRRITVSMEPQGDGIYRAFLMGTEGELPLGVLAPEGGKLTLSRWIYDRDIRRLGQLQGAVVRCSGQHGIQEGWAVLQPTDVLQAGISLVQGGWYRDREGYRELAVPFDERKPFPVPRMFCFCRIGAVCGQNAAIFSFDEKGNPAMPQG